MKKEYYGRLDILRILLFISILLYHLNLIVGGYLAVCSFFVLSGYLAVKSSFNNDKFNIFKYYYNRFKKVYFPLIITVFITILVTTLIKDINWINLKPETNSVLLNYNNFWQLDANLDYFTHHISSPFIHLWYISILIQFEIVFPFIFILFKFIGKYIHKIIPCILTLLLTISSYIYFIYLSHNNLMIGYYNTFGRLYAVFLGMFLAYVHYYYQKPITNYFKDKYSSAIIYTLYIIVILFMFNALKVTDNLYCLYMLLACLFTCRIIDYSVIHETNKNALINTFANITYEGYLIQYPLIYIFSFYKLDTNLNNTLIITLTILIALIMHFSLNIKQHKMKWLRCLLLFIILILTINGGYIYYKEKDHTKEFETLEKNLEKNEKLMEQKQKDYLENKQKQEEDWQNILANLDNEEEQIKNMVLNLPIIGIGDSVMLGAVNELYQKFPNSYIDAKVSRTDYEANGILTYLKNNNMLGNPIIVNLGTNGQCGNTCREAMLNTIEDRHIYWINVSNDYEVHVNDDLAQFAANHDNVSLIDWNSISKDHKEYFVADGIHLSPIGRNAYVEAIYNAIYNDYINEFNIKKEEAITKHEQELKEQITFYGNTLLINSYKDIENYFKNANYIINEEFDYILLKNEIEKSLNTNSLTYNIFLVFDYNFKITEAEFNELINLLQDKQVYVIILNNNIKINKDNIHIIDFQKEIETHNDYLMVDKIHLTDKGNKELVKTIKNTFNY